MENIVIYSQLLGYFPT